MTEFSNLVTLSICNCLPHLWIGDAFLPRGGKTPLHEGWGRQLMLLSDFSAPTTTGQGTASCHHSLSLTQPMPNFVKTIYISMANIMMYFKTLKK